MAGQGTAFALIENGASTEFSKYFEVDNTHADGMYLKRTDEPLPEGRITFKGMIAYMAVGMDGNAYQTGVPFCDTVTVTISRRPLN